MQVSAAPPAGGGVSTASGGGSWVPDAQVQRQIAEVFASAGSADNQVQQQVAEMYRRINELPDVACYFASILGAADFSSDVRQVAGLSLKSLLANSEKQLPEAQLRVVVPFLLLAQQDPNSRPVRAAAGSALTSLTLQRQLTQTQLLELLQQLRLLLEDPRPDVVDGAFVTLSKFCEDLLPGGRLRQAPQLPEAFVDWTGRHLLPKLLEVAENTQQAAPQQHALQILHLVAVARGFADGAPFASFFEKYWSLLGSLGASSSPRVQRWVAQGLVLALEYKPAAPLAAAEACIDFLLQCCCSGDYELQLEALEFWPLLLREAHNAGPPVSTQTLQRLRERLPQLVPVLVFNTVYQEWDFLGMDSSQLAEDDANTADDPSSVAPHFYRGRAAGEAGDGGAEAKDCSCDEEEGFAGGTQQQKSAWGDGWSVRKGSALTLDHLASVFREDILPFVLPPVDEGLRLLQTSEGQQPPPDAWLRTEAAVLTLGAVAQGCQTALAPHLGNVMACLLELSQHPKPLLRSICCWCLSRYSKWLCAAASRPPEDAGCEAALLGRVVTQLLARLLDSNKRVQEAACSAFATLEEEAGSLLLPHLSEILTAYRSALVVYKTKNLFILCDGIGTLANGVGQALSCPLGTEMIRQLLQLWLNSNSHEGIALAAAEAVACCVSAVREAFTPMAGPTVDRSLQFVAEVLQQISDANEDADRPNRELLECTLDLLSCICDGLGPEMLFVLQETQQRQQLTLLLERCCADTSAPVLQSAFALVGDLSRHCPSFLRAHVLFPLLERQLTLPWLCASVANNAGWAVGELALRLGREAVAPFAASIACRLVRLLQSPEVHRPLAQNICITLGRLGLVCATEVAPLLPEFLRVWAVVIETARNDQEKANAFQEPFEKAIAKTLQRVVDSQGGSLKERLAAHDSSLHSLQPLLLQRFGLKLASA